MLCVDPILPFYTLANTLPWLHWLSMLPIQLLLHEITVMLPNINHFGRMLLTTQSVLYCHVLTHHKVHTHKCYVNTQSSITSKYCIKPQIYHRQKMQVIVTYRLYRSKCNWKYVPPQITYINYQIFHNIKLLNVNQMQKYTGSQMAIYVQELSYLK